MDSPKENQISFEELTKITSQVRDEKKIKMLNVLEKDQKMLLIILQMMLLIK